MSQKQIILIFGSLVMLLVVGFVATWFFLQSNTGSQEAGKEPGFFDFLGFGDTNPTEQLPIIENQPTEEIVPQNGKPPRLRKLSATPVSAAIATTTKDGFMVRYVERALGHVYDIDPYTGIKIRQTQNTIPAGIQESFWLLGANNVVIRYFDREFEYAETFSATITKPLSAATGSSPFILDGEFLETRIKAIAPSETDKRIAYISTTGTGSALFTVKSDGTSKTQVYSSPVKEWLIQWFKSDTIAMTTKPSSSAPGFLYFVSTKGGQPERVLPGTFGLTTLVSPTGERVLYSEAGQNGLILKSFIRKDRKVTTIPVITLPEKCVWSKREPAVAFCGEPESIQGKEYPDTWYMGLVSFNDRVWKIDTDSGEATLIAIPKEYTRDELDMVHLSLSKNEDLLTFINKKDGNLWVLDTNTTESI